MSAEAIEIFPYDPAWPSLFEAERRLVAGAFAIPPLLIEHMGSTAVPGLPSKPIIDIVVLVADLGEGHAAISALEASGYSFWATNPDKTKLFLAKGLPPAPRRTHHLHIHADEAEVLRHLTFRDHLRASPADRDAYRDFKRVLADRFRDDREAYSRAKSGFIDAIVAKLGGFARRNS